MKASDLFVKQLEEEGVEYLFGLPGEENLDLLESLRESKIKLIVTRHEQGAAFMAATYGRLTQKSGVCMATLGPGATNLVTGIAHAQLIGAPLISISGQKAIKDNWQARFQIVDIVSLMKPITKESIQIVDPGKIPTVLREAFKHSQNERPGAVHIELPEDVAEADTDAAVQKNVKINYPRPNADSLRQAADLIQKAKYPLIIVSAGANRRNMNDTLRAFVRKTGVYVVHTQMGKGVLTDECKRSLFATGIHKRDYVNCAIDRADLIITLGYNIVEYPPWVWNSQLDKKIVNIDFVQSEPDKYFNPDVEVIGDIISSLNELGELLPIKREFEYFEKIRKLVEEKLNDRGEVHYPLHPADIVFRVREAMEHTDIISLDNGIYKLWFSRLYKTYAPNTVLLDNALATMGAGLPAAMAAKLVYPNRKVLAICGDGGFMMNSQEIETALRYNIPVVILLLNDNAFGFIKWKQKNMGHPEFALDYKNPDFVKYAESYGAKGIKVQEGDDLTEVLKRAFEMKTVVIVECPIDYSHNYDVFSKELENIVCEL